MQRLIYLVFIGIIFSLTLGCKGSQKAKVDFDRTYRFGFYNVENLFDTIDHPEKLDDDFTPTGRQQWTSSKYIKKLHDLEKVIAGMEYPSLLGLCEVENKTVLQDLINETDMSKYQYDIVHFESPDKRGIDCALLYQKDFFKVTSSRKIRIDFPESVEADYTSRDIVYVQGTFLNGQDMHVFVNHWPSRRGGLKQSEPKRIHVASYLKKEVDQIFAADPKANILIMGDLNDEPTNNSVKSTLQAKALGDKIEPATLYNCMAKLDQQNKGTYNYRGNWNMLDNIITSSNLVHPESSMKVQKPTIFRKDWMMYENPKYGPTPSRTYGGPNYYGGYSDHLPVYVEVTLKK